MKVANGIEMLELKMNMMGQQRVIHPTLIWDDNEAVLVDTGIPGQLAEIREAMEKAGVPFNKLSKVILTHQDIDHIGGMPEILNALGKNIEVLAHEVDRPYIQGEKELIKFKFIKQRVENLPEEQRKATEALLANPPKASVDRTVTDGEILPHNGGITVIFTPGHTPGHVSLYLNQSKILIAGDALTVVDGELSGPVPQFTIDIETAKKSIKKFTQFDIDTVVCYHGGIFTDNVNKRLAELADEK
jgi:glyoxylase-like metal-dependent hydrolase (beta-lactamase superfamily II)